MASRDNQNRRRTLTNTHNLVMSGGKIRSRPAAWRARRSTDDSHGDAVPRSDAWSIGWAMGLEG